MRLPRLTEVDALIRGDHARLGPNDRCYFLYEFVARGGYSAGPGNQLIHNLKKTNDKSGTPEWRYKSQAIVQAGTELRGAISSKWLDGAVIVPMPPSKTKGHKDYDDRMVQVAQQMCTNTGAAVQELLVQRADK